MKCCSACDRRFVDCGSRKLLQDRLIFIDAAVPRPCRRRLGTHALAAPAASRTIGRTDSSAERYQRISVVSLPGSNVIGRGTAVLPQPVMARRDSHSMRPAASQRRPRGFNSSSNHSGRSDFGDSVSCGVRASSFRILLRRFDMAVLSHRACFDASAARSKSDTRASISSSSIAFAAWSSTLSAARTRVDAGAFESIMIFSSVETAALDACCIRAMDCE
jgi:hypothetical protein